MLKISTALRTIPFELEDQGEFISLYVSQYAVADANKMVEIQQTLINDDGKITSYGDFIASRIVCSVKQVSDDSYYWDSVQAFNDCNYPNEMMTQLDAAVTELNPMADTSDLGEGETLLEQKKS